MTETGQNVRARNQEILYLAGIFNKAGFIGATSKARKVIAAAEARGAEEQRRKDAEASAVHVVFDGMPNHEMPRFVECENPEGFSIRVGEWKQRSDGLCELVIPLRSSSNPVMGTSTPYGYVVWENGSDNLRFTRNAISEQDMREHELVVTPVYSRPSPVNVAALEAALKAIGDEVLEGAEPFRHAVVRILKTVGIDPLNGAEPEDPVAALEAETALYDVMAERERQKVAEGWTAAHDDQYANEELAAAAACYAESAYSLKDAMRGDDSQVLPPHLWPWSDDWWKPTTQRRDLVKAAALIIAEIERLDRAALTREGGE